MIRLFERMVKIDEFSSGIYVIYEFHNKEYRNKSNLKKYKQLNLKFKVMINLVLGFKFINNIINFINQ